MAGLAAGGAIPPEPHAQAARRRNASIFTCGKRVIANGGHNRNHHRLILRTTPNRDIQAEISTPPIPRIAATGKSRQYKRHAQMLRQTTIPMTLGRARREATRNCRLGHVSGDARRKSGIRTAAGLSGDSTSIRTLMSRQMVYNDHEDIFPDVNNSSYRYTKRLIQSAKSRRPGQWRLACRISHGLRPRFRSRSASLHDSRIPGQDKPGAKAAGMHTKRLTQNYAQPVVRNANNVAIRGRTSG
jgi:hypothetical protein